MSTSPHSVDIPTVASTTAEERALLAELAASVPDGGLILEIGCLYGGTTQVLAKAAPKARIVSMDDFGWHPEGYPENSPELFMSNMESVGVKNVSVIKADSRQAWKDWDRHIDLLWIDGGHSYEFVYSDLWNFGKFAAVIAVHDYKNPAWLSIEKAIEAFMSKFPDWKIDTVAGMVAVLRRSP